MEEISQLAGEVRALRIELEELRNQVVRGSYVPFFTKKMMWALLVGIIVLASSSVFISFETYQLLVKTHEIHSLLLEYASSQSITP